MIQSKEHGAAMGATVAYPDVTLSRSVDVRCWRVVGQIARAAKRPEVVPVLERVRERGETDARDVAEHLLFEPHAREVVAERLLHIAKVYGLLEERGRSRGHGGSGKHGGVFALTPEGERALDTGEVFVPEHGTWLVWTSEDPLLPGPILRVAPWEEPNAYDEVLTREQERSFDGIPESLSGAGGASVVLPDKEGHSLRALGFERRGEAVAPEASLRVTWEVGQGRLTLTGDLGGASVASSIEPPSCPPIDVWQSLLHGAGLWRDWDVALGALRVALDATAEAEREAMKRAVEFDRPDVSGFGHFDPLVVSDTPITAHSPSDAQRWAAWRLRARVSGYATTARFDGWRRDAQAPFGGHRLDLPLRGELAERAWTPRAERPSPYAWHLIAAEDWNL